MKYILVTGSSGYIGQHLIKLLKKSGYAVYGIDNQPRLNDYLVPKKFMNFDIRYEMVNWLFTLNDWPDEFDTVIHLAALVRVNESVLNPSDYYITNINGTINVLDDIKYKNFIFASTGAAENPVSPYALSKRCAEDVVERYCIENEKTFTTFRFYNVMGSDGTNPTNTDGLLYNLMKAKETGEFKIFGNDYNTPDGTAIRDYVHVNDICRSIVMAIEKPANGLENLGTGVGHTVHQIADTFFKVNKGSDLGVKTIYLPRRNGDPEKMVLDNVSQYMIQSYTLDELVKI